MSSRFCNLTSGALRPAGRLGGGADAHMHDLHMPGALLEQIAEDLAQRAVRAGATAADAIVIESDDFSASVRLGKVENLKEAASHALGLRIFLGAMIATSYLSRISQDSIGMPVERNVNL